MKFAKEVKCKMLRKIWNCSKSMPNQSAEKNPKQNGTQIDWMIYNKVKNWQDSVPNLILKEVTGINWK